MRLLMNIKGCESSFKAVVSVAASAAALTSILASSG